MAKCLGIYRVMEAKEKPDDYIYYAIDHICAHINKMIVLCSSVAFNMEYITQRNQNCITVINTKDYDAEILKILTPNVLNAFEEILFVDDSFYGPIYNLDDLKASQENGKWDVYAVSFRDVQVNEGYKRLPQPYYVVFKTYIFDRLDIYNIAMMKGNKSLVDYLIQRFGELDFCMKTFVQNDTYISETPNNIGDYSVQISYDLIKYQKCPFVRKDVFRNADISQAGDENARRTLQYIRMYTDYDINMIWDNLIHTENVIDLKRTFHLEYILPHNCIVGKWNKLSRCAVIIHLYYQDLIKYSIEYIEEIPDEIDIYFTVSEEQMKNELTTRMRLIGRSNYQFVWKEENRGRDISALLVACKNIFMEYDIVCFIHDKKTSVNSVNPIKGKSWYYNLWDNLLKSTEYIYNILYTLEENERLGLLAAPEPCQSSYMYIYGDEWGINYTLANDLIKKWGITCNLDKDKMPFTLGSVFWCKTDALKPLFEADLCYEDFPEEPMPADGALGHAIERIIAYIAQSQGYFTGICMNTDFASIRGDKLESMLIQQKKFYTHDNDDYTKSIFKLCGQEISIINLIRFCNSFEQVYIYGAGYWGKRCADILGLLNQKFECFIISENQPGQEYVREHPVLGIGELSIRKEQSGIILALDKQHTEEVMPLLERKGIGNVYFLLR